MAYNDYGAFVYLNGERQTDYEDVPVFGERDTELGPGQRIYASLIRQMAGDDEAGETERGKAMFEWPSRCHHGVMGDGKVRVAVYKTGIGAASVYVLKDETDIADGTNVGRDGDTGDYDVDGTNPFEAAIEGAEELLALAGVEVAPYPEHYDGSPEHQAQADAWTEQRYGTYRYEFELAGHRLLFEGRECSEVVRPSYHARLTCPDGDIWDVFYDSSYGAGLSDCLPGGDGRDPRFDHIDVGRVGDGDRSAWPVTRCIPLRYHDGLSADGLVSEQAIAVSEGSLRELAESLGVVPTGAGTDDGIGTQVGDGDDSRNRILYRAMVDETDEHMPISTFSNYGDDHIVDPEAAIKLIQLGIDLARMGVDEVTSEHWWQASDGLASAAYGLDGTPFSGFSYGLVSRWMVPSEVRRDRKHPLHDDDKPSDEVIRQVFSEYRRVCEEADGTVTIDGNDAGVELEWPIRDANGVPYSPLMQVDGDGGVSWQSVRRIGDDEEERSEVVGCGWNDEKPFVVLGDGEMVDPKHWEIVTGDGTQGQG